MSSILNQNQTVDIGHGRGRLAPDAARSLARVDAARGRPSDVNSAWRDPKLQQQLRDAYEAYLRGGPWAPIAFTPDTSIHCRGYALDTDDHSPADVRLWNDHGWFQTVYRWVGGKLTLVEPWHFEYDRTRDRHLHDPAPKPEPAHTRKAHKDMPVLSVSIDRPDKKKLYWFAGDDGIIMQWNGEAYARAIEKQIGAPAAPCKDVLRQQVVERFKQQDVKIVNADDIGA